MSHNLVNNLALSLLQNIHIVAYVCFCVDCQSVKIVRKDLRVLKMYTSFPHNAKCKCGYAEVLWKFSEIYSFLLLFFFYLFIVQFLLFLSIFYTAQICLELLNKQVFLLLSA